MRAIGSAGTAERQGGNIDAFSFGMTPSNREALMKIRGIDKIEEIEPAVFRMLAARASRRCRATASLSR